jgi:hypothetical protein
MRGGFSGGSMRVEIVGRYVNSHLVTERSEKTIYRIQLASGSLRIWLEVTALQYSVIHSIGCGVKKFVWFDDMMEVWDDDYLVTQTREYNYSIESSDLSLDRQKITRTELMKPNRDK